MKEKLSISEQQVLDSINGLSKLPRKGRANIAYHKRHSRAIESLKQKSIIYKGHDNILYIKSI